MALKINSNTRSLDVTFVDGSSIENLIFQGPIIKAGAWQDDNDLKEVVIGSGVTMISEGAFKNCKSLAKVTIPTSVHSIRDGAFAGCENLKEVVFEGVDDIDGILQIGGYAFKGCTSLESVMVGESIRRIEYRGRVWETSEFPPFADLLKNLKNEEGYFINIILCRDERGSDPWR